jgi:hypothetical protein
LKFEAKNGFFSQRERGDRETKVSIPYSSSTHSLSRARSHSHSLSLSHSRSRRRWKTTVWQATYPPARPCAVFAWLTSVSLPLSWVSPSLLFFYFVFAWLKPSSACLSLGFLAHSIPPSHVPLSLSPFSLPRWLASFFSLFLFLSLSRTLSRARALSLSLLSRSLSLSFSLFLSLSPSLSLSIYLHTYWLDTKECEFTYTRMFYT